MKEKKVIDYTRTYRRIGIDKKKCILYIVILILLGFLLMWTQIDDLTRVICKIGADALKKYEPQMYVGIRSETYPLFGKISYLSAGTVYPGIQISLINAAVSLAAIILLAGLPWKGRQGQHVARGGEQRAGRDVGGGDGDIARDALDGHGLARHLAAVLHDLLP